jgi:hypothetical protein
MGHGQEISYREIAIQKQKSTELSGCGSLRTGDSVDEDMGASRKGNGGRRTDA